MTLTQGLEQLERLKGCKIIDGNDGNLTLTRMEDAGHFKNFSFPDLIKIRDFLRIHQIDHLLSVNDFFPNLAVIRGEKLFEESFALDITENKHLNEIGLSSLRHIGIGTKCVILITFSLMKTDSLMKFLAGVSRRQPKFEIILE
jgi:insulin receptor